MNSVLKLTAASRGCMVYDAESITKKELEILIRF